MTQLAERTGRRDPAGRPGAVDIARALGRPDPTPEQVAVIEAPLSPLLVVAGAGSGKTETMAARVVWLVAGGDVAPDEVLGLTFTRKASGELSDRIRGRLRALRRSGLWVPGGPLATDGDTGGAGVASGEDLLDGDVTVSTYHAFAGRLVREHGLRLGHEPEAQLMTEASCWQLAAEVVQSWTGEMDQVDFAASTVVDALLALSAECAEHLVTPDDLDAYLAERVEAVQALPYNATTPHKQYAEVAELVQRLGARRQLLPLVREYQRVKRAQERLDFGDQLAISARLARDVPQLGEQAREQYRAVLLDEFQDTSHAQLVMLEALFGSGHAVTAVGDPHQSIYGWRGASADTLAGFADRFRDVDGRPAAVRHLSTSWRNPTTVLEVANTTAAPLQATTRVPVRDLVARPDAGAGSVQVRALETSALEAASVVDWLAGQWLGPDGRPRPGRTAAVLCRKRSQFTDVEAALLARGLPYEVVGLGGLLSTPEVADLVCALHVVHDPGRGDMLMRLLTGPSCRLGPHDLVALGGWARELHRRRAGSAGPGSPAGSPSAAADEASIVEALDDLPAPGWTDRDGRGLSAAARVRLERLADVVRDLRGRTSLSLPDLVGEVERALLLDVEVASRPGVRPGQARAHLDALAQVAAGFEASAERATLGAFLSWLAAADEQEHGLEPGQVEVNEHAVQVMTVHAAKGLEWDVVAVPGLVEGGFPQHRCPPRAVDGGWVVPQVTDKGWLGGLGSVPHALRGDRDGLPDVRWSGAPDQVALRAELATFYAACGEHELAEERRLAYVAFTRAREALLLTCHSWGSALNPRVPSRFLTELVPGLSAGEPRVRDDLAGSVVVGPVCAVPQPGQEKPDDAELGRVRWPQDPLGERRRDVESGAALVEQAMTALPLDLTPDGSGGHVEDASDRAISLLLAERDRALDRAQEVELPTHLSASRLVRLREDPAALALALRRPVPREPRATTRRGTAFHAWVERYLGAASILDVVDLPGAADEDAGDAEDLAALQEWFLASEWASRPVVAVEVPVETPVDGTVLRGRIDAVLARPDGGVDVVDWKTGRPPTGEAAAAAAVQLAVYRLAWHRLTGQPLDRIGAAFVYVAAGRTDRPVDLLDAEGLAELLRSVTR